MRVSRPAVAIIATAAASLALAACAGSPTGNNDAGGDQSEVPEASAQFPITVTHAFGETVIEEQPERIATVGWSNQEAALALGVVPVVMEEATWGDDDGDGVLPWVEDKLTELGAQTPEMYDGTDGVDFEAIGDAAPDVILAAYSGITEDDYGILSEIAPVVAFPDVAWGTTWQQTITVNGTALGLQTEAEALVADLESHISEAVDGYANLGGGQGAAFAWFDVTDLSSVGFYTMVDPRQVFLSEQAGFTVPEAVTAAGTEEFLASAAAEAVDELSDFDVIVTYGTGEELEVLQADPLLSRIPAVANGAIVFLDETVDPATAASANPSPLGISHLIENYLPLLDETAGKAS
ncbi:ABC transporter substrate-binding protein [Pseudactinotalea suaedae]|uniref:ABC transporter substrate-binding protein n=1 Tax=Pseudactinotalea suaedae TaxID=1524924 RepID=UPI0012E249D6|nr:ABC transporter substrate-binding protein [Pseudactinotalea suaedae]